MAAIVSIAALLFLLIPRMIVSDGALVEVSSGRELRGKFPLSEDLRLEAPGPLGKTEIEIMNGQVRILSSPCRNKICVNMGSVGREGGVLVCVPNEVVVGIGYNRSDDLDAVSP